jgi:hypothetical protein
MTPEEFLDLTDAQLALLLRGITAKAKRDG